MEAKHVLLFFLFHGFKNNIVFGADEDLISHSGYFATRENKRLDGYVIKRFESSSVVSCSQSCLRKPWCSSTNFKMSSENDGKGTCELNKQDSLLIKENTNFQEQEGVTFSMLLKGCLMTGCLNGGSCVSYDKNQTYSCMCKKLWIGDKCEVKMDLDDCASQPCKNNGTCADQGNGYNCTCAQGYYGTLCEREVGMPCTKAYRMIFPRNYSTEDYAIEANAVGPNLSAFTLCFFVKLKDVNTHGSCLYSYATSESKMGNAIYICFPSGEIEFNIADGDSAEASLTMHSNQWHHICATWNNTQANGDWQLYKDGHLLKNGTGMMVNNTVPSGGTVVIGQDQDSVGGGFDESDAFGPGEVTQVNMWDTVLSESDIASQHANCTITSGLIHSWAQFKDGVHGDVQIVDP